jgi:hypothetical protein
MDSGGREGLPGECDSVREPVCVECGARLDEQHAESCSREGVVHVSDLVTGVMVTAGSMSSDGWAVWLAIKRHEGVGSIPQMAQRSGICPPGQGTTKAQRVRATDALSELEDLGLIERSGGRYLIHRDREAST